MTLIKTRARGLKLDDTFAFTGTVSGAGGGKILAVYQDYTTSETQTTTDNTYTDISGLAITLTPASSSSKFWLNWNTHPANATGSAQAFNFSMDFKRAISGGTTTSAIINTTNSSGMNRRYNYDNRSDDLAGINYFNPCLAISWLDSPSTASAITYTCQFNKYQWAGTSGQNMGVNGGLFQIMEVSS